MDRISSWLKARSYTAVLTIVAVLSAHMLLPEQLFKVAASGFVAYAVIVVLGFIGGHMKLWPRYLNFFRRHYYVCLMTFVGQLVAVQVLDHTIALPLLG